MKAVKKVALVLFVLLIAFVIHTLVSTGFFRTITHQFDGELVKKVALNGAEDITISHEDHFALISATNRRSNNEGGLYSMNLKSNDYKPIHLTKNLNIDFNPHGISFYKKDSVYHILAVNHTKNGHSIESFELINQQLIHKKTIKHHSMISPNDVVMIDENRFYFTNDHKYTRGFKYYLEEYLGLALSNVVYFDGKEFKEVAKNIGYANGINYDKNRNLLFVASPRKFLVKVFNRKEDGSLSFIENIDCGTGVDNIEFDEKGNLWIGSHPNLLKFSFYMLGKYEVAPSEVIKIEYRNKGDYSVETIYTDDGYEVSASTVAAIYQDLIFVGNVIDDHFIILKQ